MIGLYKFANIEGDNAKRYRVITESLERDGLTFSVETKENGWIYIQAKGKAKPRRAHARASGPKLPAVLTVASIQKKLDGLLDRSIRPRRYSWGYYGGFNAEGRKADKTFGRAIAGVIARVGMEAELSSPEMAECGEHYYMAGFRMTARALIESRKRRYSYDGANSERSVWLPVRERYTDEKISEVAYTIELLRLAKDRESAKTAKAEKAARKRAGAPVAVVELAKAA